MRSTGLSSPAIIAASPSPATPSGARSVVKIALVGEAYGEAEEYLKTPFVGQSGQELTRILADAGISRDDCFITNVFNIRPKDNDLKHLCVPAKDPNRAPGLPPIDTGKYVRAEYLPEIHRLAEEIRIQRPNVTVALGNTACWALLNTSGISKLRGTTAVSSLVSGAKILPTYHPAAILRQWDLRAVTVADLMKAKRESEFPEIRRTRRELWLNPSLKDLAWFFYLYIKHAPSCVFDIETMVLGNRRQIDCIGFAPSPTLAINIPFFDPRKPPSNNYWPTLREEQAALRWVRHVLTCGTPMIAQNGMYDISWLWRDYGLTIPAFDEDTMLLHHALQPEAPKSLGFLGSVYCDEMAWKTLNSKQGVAKRDE